MYCYVHVQCTVTLWGSDQWKSVCAGWFAHFHDTRICIGILHVVLQSEKTWRAGHFERAWNPAVDSIAQLRSMKHIEWAHHWKNLLLLRWRKYPNPVWHHWAVLTWQLHSLWQSLSHYIFDENRQSNFNKTRINHWPHGLLSPKTTV